MMRSKPKIITDELKDKLKDKIIRDIWTLYDIWKTRTREKERT